MLPTRKLHHHNEDKRQHKGGRHGIKTGKDSAGTSRQQTVTRQWQANALKEHSTILELFRN
jgi:hypothetical protein